jgi:hypothetical protein
MKFEEVNAYYFYTYIEDIRKFLREEAPEYQLTSRLDPATSMTLFYIEQQDFTRKLVHPSLQFDRHIFAYEDKNHHYILDKYPINQTESERK